jgi:murein DD-endopeptidase MepM/ murein hydrolase activator NlpD
MHAHKTKRITRLLCSALALLCVVTFVAGELTPSALAVTQSEIDDLQADADKLAEQKEQLEDKLDALSDDKANALERKNLLDQQISNLQSQIDNAETQIEEYAQLISQTEAELQQAEEEEEAQYELFCERVRAMEERGKVSYWSVLFKAESFSDLLSRLDFINEIMDSDQSVIDQLQELQDQIEEKKTSLEDSKAQTESLRSQLVSQRSELDTQRSEANALVAEIEANENEYQSTLDAIDAEEEAIQAKIVQLSKELAAQQGGGSSSAALGGYIWPVSSRRITSPFGNRNTGIAGASTNHKGVDIGGVYYSSQVHAAKAGTVIVSQYSSSYGNYVVVSHGSGNTTLYAHMSSRSVSVGQWVDQGDVLGITGSTGISSGPHLHFEITENGVRVDPLKYLTGYVQAW